MLRQIVVRSVAAILLSLAALSPAYAQSPVDLLGVPGPIGFQGADYTRAWTSRPSADYYKQEYLPAGQKVESYTDMFMVETVTKGLTLENAVAAQVEKLNQRKGADPLVNYDIVRNDQSGEIILDFIISDSSNGLIVEWNAYRYVKAGDGVAIFAISRRGYGDDAKPFLMGLKAMRPAAIEALAAFDAPALSPAP